MKKNYKCFIAYLYNDYKVKPLHIMLPKKKCLYKKFWWANLETDVYFDSKWWLIEKYNTIWDKVSADIKKLFDSEPAHNKNFWKTKVKSHDDKITDFYNKKFSRVNFNHTYLTVISLDSALKKDEDYYPQVFLKECKYIEKE